jgi:hypothetical protein
MSSTFNPSPEVPPEIENAAQSGELVVFVGAGISRLIKCPSWDGFADKVLEQLVPDGIDYHELSQINAIRDPKKRLSIAKIIVKKNIRLIINQYLVLRLVRITYTAISTHLIRRLLLRIMTTICAQTPAAQTRKTSGDSIGVISC